MNSAVVRLDQIMSKLLTSYKHCLKSWLLRFVLPNVIYLNLNYKIIKPAKLLYNILESAMSSSRRPMNQICPTSKINGSHVIDLRITSTVAFMKPRNSLVIQCTENRVNWKKIEAVKMFFKTLAIRFR